MMNLRISQLRLFLFFSICMTCPSFALDEQAPPQSEGIQNEKEIYRTQLLVGPGYTMMSAAGKKLNSVTLGGGLIYGFSQNWGASIQIRQGLASVTNSNTVFTALSPGITYSLFAPIVREKRTVKISAETIYQEIGSPGISVLVSASLNQYFFNTSTAAIPYTGIGFSGLVKFPFETRWDLLGGLTYDMLSAGTKKLTPMLISVGMSYWIF